MREDSGEFSPIRPVSAFRCARSGGVLTAATPGHGGEKFAVVFPGTPAAAAVLPKRVRRAFAEFPWPHRAVTVSGGAATAPHGHVDPTALTAEADAALYRAKREGRNRAHDGSDVIALPRR